MAKLEERRITIVLNGDGSLRTIMQHDLIDPEVAGFSPQYTLAEDIDADALSALMPDRGRLVAKLRDLEGREASASEAIADLAALRAKIEATSSRRDG